MQHNNANYPKRALQWAGNTLMLLAMSLTFMPADSRAAGMDVTDLAELCEPTAVEAVVSKLSFGVTVESLPQAQMPGPFLPGGTAYKPAANSLPAYCQVTGTYLTNAKIGKTAHYLATFPANWNGKYLQIGCGGHCGTFAVSDPATFPVTITTQGKPGDMLARGYAVFATDEGHVGFSSASWAVKGPAEIDQEAVDDLLYRAHKVLSKMGKAFTTAFYAQAAESEPEIDYAYFSGCSGGGRDALIAASYFPEAFDGIISGSPYANMVGTAFQSTGVSLATIRSPNADVPPELVAQIEPIVMKQCDTLDGVADGLIQNPMACDFLPGRDLPQCADDQPGSNCFTKAQIETISAVLTAVTDENGNVVQPGYSVSELQASFRLSPAPEDLNTPDPWPDTGNPATGGGSMATLGNGTLKVLVHENDPAFNTRSLLAFAEGGTGSVTGFRVVVPQKEVELAEKKLRMGIPFPENAANLLKLDHKLLIWANLSDHLLTPYMSVNYYKRLASEYGGYDKLQKNVRLFSLPGTAHCSGSLLVGPGSFDALKAMENWVEKGEAPNGILATQYPATPYGANFSKPSTRTMPLCMFPQMARYSGKGDVNDAANWHCPAEDIGLLTVGESGKQAGVVQP
ncbi:MAG: tannase/feruloyl esterase family alpha/beta hydrolase [Halioglobus sp.]|nr:tannase/feruloyl esterase family alpha/beta hydrolase [Halioglobus sp.]